MTTPISSSIPYATPADFRSLADTRQIGDLVLDTGARETGNATLDADAVISKALMAASGMIESACLRADVYTVNDLQALTGASREYLVALVCELAYWRLYSRRHRGKPMLPESLWAFSELEALTKGAKLFGLQEAADAGLPIHDFVTAAEYQTLGLASTQAVRMTGTRANVTRGGSGGDFTNP